jgi:outer membrane immunogenic protein
VIFLAQKKWNVVPKDLIFMGALMGPQFGHNKKVRDPTGRPSARETVRIGIVMRKSSLTLLAAAAIGLAASQASAADLPRKAPPAYIPPAPPPITWTGCYIGANIGGIFGRREADFGFGDNLSSDNSGFAGGGQIGCDYQFVGTGWVIGFRNMFDGSSLSRDRTITFATGDVATVNFENNWFDTLTGRIGYSFTPAWLWYFQGGAAWAKNSADVTFNGFDVGSVSRTRTGWTIGGGVEWRFAPQWSAFLEGNYMDFGSTDRNLFAVGTVCDPGCAFSTKATATTVLVGLNYRFNWGKAPY